MDQIADIRQSAFALLGDLARVSFQTFNFAGHHMLDCSLLIMCAKMYLTFAISQVCPAHLHPRLADFLSVAAEQLVGNTLLKDRE